MNSATTPIGSKSRTWGAPSSISPTGFSRTTLRISRSGAFRAASSAPGEFALVFASGEGQTPESSPPHANFRLGGDGEFLALVRADGLVVQEFTPAYPQQYSDVAYGVEQEVSLTNLITAETQDERSDARVWIPTSDASGLGWTAVDFDDSTWTLASLGVGYDTGETAGPIPGEEINLALTGVASQSSTVFSGEASRAIDGHTGGAFAAGSTTHSGNEPGAWWQVDLGDTFPLERIVLWNRTDCCTQRLSYFRLSVMNDSDDVVFSSDHFVDGSSPANPDYEIALPAGTHGRVVRIAKLGPDRGGDHWFSLAEVQVFEGRDGFGPLVGTDLEASMRDRNASAYIRIPFTVDDPSSIDFLELRMKYDDGFVAYLNGREVVRRHAPEPAEWNATSTAERPDERAYVFESFNVSADRDVVSSRYQRVGDPRSERQYR